MKKTAILILLVSFMINPAIVCAAKKTMTKYLIDTNVEAVATETSSWRDEKTNYAIFAPSGNLTLSSATKLYGNIYVKTITATNAVEINGNVIFGGADVSFQSVTVNGSICANGNLTMKQSTISGDINAQGNVTMNSGTTVGGSVYANGYVYLAENPVTVSSAVHAGGSVKIVDNCSANTVCYCNLCSTCSSCTLTLSGSGKIKTPPATKGSCTAPVSCVSVTTPVPTEYNSSLTASYTTIDPSSSGTTTTITPGAYYINLRLENTTLVMKAGTAGTCSKYGDSGCYYLKGFNAGQNSNQKLKLDFSNGGQIVIFSEGDINWAGQVYVSTDGVNYYDINTYYTSYQADAVALAKKTYWETHGAFTIKTPSLPRHWFGTVLTTSGNMTIPDTTYIVGAFATVSGSISQNNNVTMYYVLANYARAHW